MRIEFKVSKTRMKAAKERRGFNENEGGGENKRISSEQAEYVML